MNKIDRYDGKKLLEAKRIITEVYEYNYLSEYDSLTRKLTTILNKIDKVLETELEPKLQEEFSQTGRV